MASRSLATLAVLAVFLAGAFPAWDGVLQRVGVSLPLAALCAVAARLLATARGAPGGGAA